MSKISGLFASVAAAALSLALMGAPAYAGDIVGLITKTNTNPFFVKMKEGFEAKAKELGLTPQAYAGKFDGDNDGEVRAIEQLIAAGAKGILLVPSNSTAIVPTVEEGAQRRRSRHHARHAARSDHGGRRQFRHRQFQGRRTDRRVGEGDPRRQGQDAPRSPRSTSPPNEPTVDYLRHNGFLTGFGIPVKDPKHYARATARRSSAPT